MERPFASELINTETVPSQIAKLIRKLIIDGKLSVNERLPTEVELAVQFGVSRPTIREALKRLAAQNLIRSQRGPTGGNFVSGPSMENAKAELAAVTAMLVGVGDISILDLAEARQQLEGVCVAMAARNRTDAHLQALAEEISEQKKIGLSDVEFCASDVNFHRTLTVAAGNKLLEFLMVAIVEAIQPVSNLIVFRYRDRLEIIRHHECILAHLKNHDGDGAVAAINEQMEYLREFYLRAQAARKSKDQARSAAAD